MEHTNCSDRREDAVKEKITEQENQTTSQVGPETRKVLPHTYMDLVKGPGSCSLCVAW
jgi:hypothetical protein